MEQSFINELSIQLGTFVKSVHAISGGDISDAFLIETSTNRFFLKTNAGPNALDMFIVEKEGLSAIAKTNAIKTPAVYAVDMWQSKAYLLLEYVETKRAESIDYECLGQNLANLHKHQESAFGWYADNYIGNLPQRNHRHQNWASFYWQERLLPQLEMAVKSKLIKASVIPETPVATHVLKQWMDNVSPCLLHGDLWSGNYLIAVDGRPYLIDPAVYFGHGEVDIAMSQLFGGFSTHFYQAYQEESGTIIDQSRIELYQLYYLLVHLNLFGATYSHSVMKIMQRYF